MNRDVKFICYDPQGHIWGQLFPRPMEIFVLADHFLSRGGRFRVVFHDGYAEILGTVEGKDDHIRVACEVVRPGEDWNGAIDRVVRTAVDAMVIQ